MTDYIHSVFSFLEIHCLNLKLFYCHHQYNNQLYPHPRGSDAFTDVTLLLQTGGYLFKRHKLERKRKCNKSTRRQLGAGGKMIRREVKRDRGA